MHYVQCTNEYFFKNITPCTCVWFRGGSVLCHGARVSRAATPRTCPPIPGGAAPVPCALPRATKLGRPTAYLPPFRRESGGTSTVNQCAAYGGTPTVNQRAAAKLPLCQ